jgi:hypothetical protein
VTDRHESDGQRVPPDRRIARSADTLVALTRLLDGSRQASGLDAVVVADPTGFLVAGSGAFRTCEELAAYAPLAGAANDVIPTRLDVLSRRTEVRRLSIDGIEVLLCGRGADAGGRAVALEHAAAGCERILGRRLHAIGQRPARV